MCQQCKLLKFYESPQNQFTDMIFYTKIYVENFSHREVQNQFVLVFPQIRSLIEAFHILDANSILILNAYHR